MKHASTQPTSPMLYALWFVSAFLVLRIVSQLRPPPPLSRVGPPQGLYALSALDIDGNDMPFDQFNGYVSLVLNTASLCGYTATNYQRLEPLYQEFKERKFMVVAFPCGQFANQEPGSNAEIKEWARREYGVTFKMMAKIEVNGNNTHPVYAFLKQNLPPKYWAQRAGQDPNGSWDLAWNFQKILVDRKGMPRFYFDQAWNDAEIRSAIETLLAE